MDAPRDLSLQKLVKLCGGSIASCDFISYLGLPVKGGKERAKGLVTFEDRTGQVKKFYSWTHNLVNDLYKLYGTREALDKAALPPSEEMLSKYTANILSTYGSIIWAAAGSGSPLTITTRDYPRALVFADPEDSLRSVINRSTLTHLKYLPFVESRSVSTIGSFIALSISIIAAD